MSAGPAAAPALETVELAGGAARIDLPVGWAIEPGPPTVATPHTWPGEPPAVVVSVEHDALAGDDLAIALAAAAATRLADPVVVSLGLVGPAGADDGDSDTGSDSDTNTDTDGDTDSDSDEGADDGDRRDVQIVVAHRHRGVDVTTVERHHSHPSGVRRVVGFTAAHPDVARLLPLADRVVGSLRVES